MKLTYYRAHVPNFGDELNPYLFPRLLPPGFLDGKDDELLLGIGSIILDSMPKKPMKHVIGSGYAYLAAPDMQDGSWNVVFVRGPRSAASLGLPASTAICDGAILLRAIELPEPAPEIDVAFMPHYESLDRGLWPEACRLAGIPMIDPRADVETIISRIRGTRMLITEAMHGAIVADALRTPWVAIKPINKHHQHKWFDWSEALGIDLRRNSLRPSSTMELYVAVSRGRGEVGGRAGRWSRSALARPLDSVLPHLAAESLRRLCRVEPQLSADARIGEATERAVAAFESFVGERTERAAQRAGR